MEIRKRSKSFFIFKNDIVSKAFNSPTSLSDLKTANPIFSAPFSPKIEELFAFIM